MITTEMNIHGVLGQLPKIGKQFLLVFIAVLSFGYGVGLIYLNNASGSTPIGLEEHYLGNESDMDAQEMKFKKSQKGMLTLIHGHVISFALIFFVMGGLFLFSSYRPILKKILCIEPLVSTVTTFGGIWLLWYGVTWMKYVVIVSGALMHLSFLFMVILLTRDLIKK